MSSELGLRAEDPINPVSWLIIGLLCLAMVIIWLYVKRKNLDQSNSSISHQRFPLGGQCYLISIQFEGSTYKLYETPRGLVQLNVDCQNTKSQVS
jgi:hypothetical protein